MCRWSHSTGYVHYRLLSRRRVTWRHLLVLSAMDIALITASVVVDGGFRTPSCSFPTIPPLANAFRHAGASRVLVELDFGRDKLRLSVSDDGVGLPDDYEERGHGFENMRAYAGRLGGRLIVEPRGPVGGASVTCVVRLDGREQGRTGCQQNLTA